jgi:integrase
MIVKRKTFTDKKGNTCKCPKWYIDFRDHQGKRHIMAGFESKRPTEQLSRNIEVLITCLMSGDNIPRELQNWIDGLSLGLSGKFVKWGLLDGQRASQVKPLISHLSDYEAELIAKNKSQIHVQKTISRCKAIAKGCKFRYLKDINASAVIKHLARMRDNDGAAAGTRNHFLTALKCFCNWAVKAGRISSSPLKHVSKEKAEAKQRGILLPEQFQSLIAKTFEQGTTRLNVSAIERSMLYILVGATGLRKKEIVALKWEHLKLSDNESCVILPGTKTKNGKEAKQPLPPQVAMIFSAFREQHGIKDDMRVFPKVRYHINTAALVRKDLKAAGLQLLDFEGREIDFHSLRTSFISFLANSDTPFKAVQTLARHSDPKLTFNVYAKMFKETENKAMSSLPTVDLTSHAVRSIMNGHFTYTATLPKPFTSGRPARTNTDFGGVGGQECKKALNPLKTANSEPSELIPEVGIEPTPCYQDGILNPARLPIPPLRHE